MFYACGYSGAGVAPHADLPFPSRAFCFGGRPWLRPFAVPFYSMLDRWDQR